MQQARGSSALDELAAEIEGGNVHWLWWSTGAGWAPGSFTPASPSWFDGNNRMVNTVLGIQLYLAGDRRTQGGVPVV
jgi:hypothetical protein